MTNIMKSIVLISALSLPLLSTIGLTGCAVKQKDETVGQYLDGGVITTTVKSKLLADKQLKNTTITVTTFHNTVQLSGFVNSNKQRLHAAEVAMSVEGVKNVDNALVIKKMIISH